MYTDGVYVKDFEVEREDPRHAEEASRGTRAEILRGPYTEVARRIRRDRGLRKGSRPPKVGGGRRPCQVPGRIRSSLIPMPG